MNESTTDDGKEPLVIKSEFDLSARKYLDWIDSIERILDEKSSSNVSTQERQEIIQVLFEKLFNSGERTIISSFLFLGCEKQIFFIRRTISKSSTYRSIVDKNISRWSFI